MCLAQGLQCSDAGEATTEPLRSLGQVEPYFVKNPKDRFSHDEAHMVYPEASLLYQKGYIEGQVADKDFYRLLRRLDLSRKMQ